MGAVLETADPASREPFCALDGTLALRHGDNRRRVGCVVAVPARDRSALLDDRAALTGSASEEDERDRRGRYMGQPPHPQKLQ